MEIGDVVLLKSGGPKMTVVSANEREIRCKWLSDRGELGEAYFPEAALCNPRAEAELARRAMTR